MVTIVVHLRPHIKPFLALESHQGSLFSSTKGSHFLWKKGQDNNTTLMKEFFFWIAMYHQAALDF